MRRFVKCFLFNSLNENFYKKKILKSIFIIIYLYIYLFLNIESIRKIAQSVKFLFIIYKRGIE